MCLPIACALISFSVVFFSPIPAHATVLFNAVGGNANVLLTPLQHSLSATHALLVMFSGMYLLGGLLFALILALYLRHRRQQPLASDTSNGNEDPERAPLLT